VQIETTTAEKESMNMKERIIEEAGMEEGDLIVMIEDMMIGNTIHINS